MGALQANWHNDVLDLPPIEDPFDVVEIEKVGMPIDLTAGVPKLAEELEALLAKEGRLYNNGVTCAIKDHGDSCCSACPVSKLGQDDPVAALCRLGARQEEVLTGLVAARQREHGG
jgi:hypothetical protein